MSTQGSLTTGKVRVTVLDILVHPMTGIAVNGGNTSASCSAPSPATFVWLVAICVYMFLGLLRFNHLSSYKLWNTSVLSLKKNIKAISEKAKLL